MNPRIGLLWILLLLAACSQHRDPSAGLASGAEGNSGTTGLRFLGGGDTTGFARATAPQELVFPLDHGAHDEYRNEWWYFTGNLVDTGGRRFGFELTFFRFALAPSAPTRESHWGSNQTWMAHFAVTDVARGRFVAAERFARGGALDLGGTSSNPFRVWVKDWSVAGSADAATATLALSARDAGTSIALELSALKPVVLHGDAGLDAKGPEPGNASFYYSFPRLAARGSIEVAGERADVSGSAWMDREWGTSALSPGIVGWDWFALQLSDGRELMLYRLRDRDGTASAFSSGSLIGRDGDVTRLAAEDVELEPTTFWTSERTAVRYPVAWRLAVPKERLALSVEPYVQDQEVNLTVRYWEGAVRANGVAGVQPIEAQGYLELAGY